MIKNFLEITVMLMYLSVMYSYITMYSYILEQEISYSSCPKRKGSLAM